MSNITPDRRVQDDWWQQPIPENVTWGEGLYLETAQIFRFMRSKRHPAVELGAHVSALTTKYRDLTQLVSFGLQLWMFATPIVYPASKIPAASALVTSRLTNLVSASMIFFISASICSMSSGVKGRPMSKS